MCVEYVFIRQSSLLLQSIFLANWHKVSEIQINILIVCIYPKIYKRAKAVLCVLNMSLLGNLASSCNFFFFLANWYKVSEMQINILIVCIYPKIYLDLSLYIPESC